MTGMRDILAGWGGGEILGALGGGARSRLFRVRTGGGLHVLREGRESAPSLRWLDSVHARAERAGLVVPRLVPTLSGALSARGWTLEIWLDGQPARTADVARIAPAIRQFHRLTRDVAPRPGLPDVGARCDLPRTLARRCARVAGRGGMAAVHGDLHPGNLLRLPGGRLALVDWEEARRDLVAYDEAALSGDPLHPLRLAYEVAAGWSAEPAHARRCARLLVASSGHSRPAGLALQRVRLAP